MNDCCLWSSSNSHNEEPNTINYWNTSSSIFQLHDLGDLTDVFVLQVYPLSYGKNYALPILLLYLENNFNLKLCKNYWKFTKPHMVLFPQKKLSKLRNQNHPISVNWRYTIRTLPSLSAVFSRLFQAGFWCSPPWLSNLRTFQVLPCPSWPWWFW